MPRNRSELDPAAHLHEGARVYAHMVVRRNQLMPGSIERAEATDTLLSYWHGKMQSHERNAYSALDSAERLTMLAKIHRLMREGKLK